MGEKWNEIAVEAGTAAHYQFAEDGILVLRITAQTEHGRVVDELRFNSEESRQLLQIHDRAENAFLNIVDALIVPRLHLLGCHIILTDLLCSVDKQQREALKKPTIAEDCQYAHKLMRLRDQASKDLFDTTIKLGNRFLGFSDQAVRLAEAQLDRLSRKVDQMKRKKI